MVAGQRPCVADRSRAVGNLLCWFGNSYLTGTRDHSNDIAAWHSA